MIQRMLAIWSLVPLLFLKPAWTSGSSQFTYCWSLAWRILSITLLACEMMQFKMCILKLYHLPGFLVSHYLLSVAHWCPKEIVTTKLEKVSQIYETVNMTVSGSIFHRLLLLSRWNTPRTWRSQSAYRYHSIYFVYKSRSNYNPMPSEALYWEI